MQNDTIVLSGDSRDAADLISVDILIDSAGNTDGSAIAEVTTQEQSYPQCAIDTSIPVSATLVSMALAVHDTEQFERIEAAEMQTAATASAVLLVAPAPILPTVWQTHEHARSKGLC